MKQKKGSKHDQDPCTTKPTGIQSTSNQNSICYRIARHSLTKQYFKTTTMTTVLAQDYSANEFFVLGLETAGHKRWRQHKPCPKMERFRHRYGVTPQTCAEIWRDLSLSETEECRLATSANPLHLLLAFRFLFKCHEEEELGVFFHLSPNTDRKWTRLCVVKIKLLLPTKMPTLEEADVGLTFLFTIDGTHCPIEEPRPFSTIWSSHKFGGSAGLNYEIGLRIDKPQLLWLYGPTAPGAQPDITVFRQKFLPVLERHAADGRPTRGIADQGYRGEPQYLSTKNDFDLREIAEFKDRACARHENFNQRLKLFKCLSTKWRHGVENHRSAFEAVAVLTIYQLENGSASLFDPYP